MQQRHFTITEKLDVFTTARVQPLFLVFFKVSRMKKLFIPKKSSITVQAIKVCPVRPRVLSSWGLPLIREAEGCR